MRSLTGLRPRRFRGRRRGVVVHHAPGGPSEQTTGEDAHVKTVERTLLDVARSFDPSLDAFPSLDIRPRRDPWQPHHVTTDPFPMTASSSGEGA